MGHKQGTKVTATSTPDLQGQLFVLSHSLYHKQTIIFARYCNFRHGLILQKHATFSEIRTLILKAV